MGSQLTSRAEDLEPSLSGARLGRYLLQERLGQGGFGSVYRAEDTKLGRPVAVKVLTRTDAAGLQRFHREAKVLSRLKHPNLVTVHDAGESDDHPYLVLELVEGEALEAYCEPTRLLPVERVVTAIRQAAEAIEVAHGHGVLHRDLKPANLLLSGGSTKVVDFGLAFLLEPAASRLSQTGAWVGSPAYMAPEQTGSAPPDARTDVYGLGATLYHALCGRTPLEAAHDAPPAVAIREHVPPPPSRWRKGVPAALDALCARCLAKDPAQRFPSAGALAAALRACLDPAPRRLSWAPALGLLLCFVLGLGWAWLSGRPAARGPQAAELLARATNQPPGRAGDATTVRLLEDALSEARGTPLEVEVLRALGRHHFFRCRFADALVVAEQALALDPESLATRTLRADCLMHVGRSAECLAALRAIRDDDPAGVWGLQASADLVRTSDEPGSARIARQVLELDPTFQPAWLSVGYGHLAERRPEESRAAFERAGELEPRDPRPEIGLISVAGHELRDDEALERTNRLLADLGDDAPPALVAMRGKIYHGLDQQTRAEADLSRALEADPDDADFLFWRGMIRLRQGRREEASADFRRSRANSEEVFERTLTMSCAPRLAEEIRRVVAE
jgi:serine/threonine-protein kinase